jgi:hypothetical protein
MESALVRIAYSSMGVGYLLVLGMDRIESETIFGMSMLPGCAPKKTPSDVGSGFFSTDFSGKIEARCKVPPLPRRLRGGDSCSLEAGRARARPLERLKIGQLFRISVSTRKDPFAMSTGHWQRVAADHAKRRSTSPIPNRGIDSPIDRRDCLNEHNRLMASECVGQE